MRRGRGGKEFVYLCTRVRVTTAGGHPVYPTTLQQPFAERLIFKEEVMRILKLP
jgi:hypothetical protein